MLEQKNKSKIKRANPPILVKVIQDIIAYTSHSPVFELITYALVIICVLIITIFLIFPKFVLVVFTLLFLICCLSAGVFHFKANDIPWSLWILDRFTELFFEQSGDIIKNYFPSRKISLALSLTASLKLLSICGAICSLTLVFLTAMNTTSPVVPIANRPTPLTVQPVMPPPVIVTVQAPIIPTVDTAMPLLTRPLTNTEVSSSGPNQSPTSQQTGTITPTHTLRPPVTPSPIIITTQSKATITPLNNFVSSEPTPIQMQLTVEAYRELLNTILPKIVIVDIKNFSQINNGLDEDQDEYVVIANYGDEVDMSDWYISDMQGHIYHFEDFRLSRASVVRLHTSVGTDTDFDLYWGHDDPIWTIEEPDLFLFDDTGAIIDKW